MKRIIPTIVLAGAILSACGGPPDVSNANAPAMVPDPMEAKIAALTPSLQRTTFFRAVRDAGFNCQQIVTVEKRARISDRAVWGVGCEDGGTYVLTLQPAGVFTVSGAPNAPRSGQ